MKKVIITFEFDVTNGEWDDKKKISRNCKTEHEIDLDLFNDENTFQCVMSRINHEFEDGIRKAIGQVMQHMIDERPDAEDCG